MPYLPTTFAQLEPDESDYATSRSVVLPLPFERTTSYGKGTVDGPDAILRASQALEVYDEELDREPCPRGIATLPPFLPEAHAMEEALREIQTEARRVMEDDKFLVSLGGEHSITSALVFAARATFGDELGVVQFDAHTDLREEYEGTPWSHASVMRRIVEAGLPTLGVGIRSLSAPEAALVKNRDLDVLWGHQLDDPDIGRLFEQRLDALPDRVYLTFDVDFFDPSLVPSTGTPEPGGGTWYPTLRLLRTLFERKTVVAMDVVELAPIGGQPAPDFVTAKLVYKCMGYEQIIGD